MRTTISKESMFRQKERYKLWVENAPLCKCGCGKKVGVTKKVLSRSIASYKYSRSLPGHNSSFGRSIKLSKKMRDVLVGSDLGDGSISYGNKHSEFPRLSFNHSVKQRDYAIWKTLLLKPMVFNEGPQRKTSFGGTVFNLQTKSYPCLSEFRSIFYCDGRKIIPSNIAEYLTPLAIAIWFMDDGSSSCNKKGEKNSCTLHTNRYSIEENILIKNALLSLYGIETTIRKNRSYYYIYINSKEKFFKLISKYVPPSMRYKIENKKYC